MQATWDQDQAKRHLRLYRAAVQKARSIDRENYGDDAPATSVLGLTHPFLHGTACILRALEPIDSPNFIVDDSLVRSLQQIAFLVEPAISVTLAVVDPDFPDLETHVSVRPPAPFQGPGSDKDGM